MHWRVKDLLHRTAHDFSRSFSQIFPARFLVLIRGIAKSGADGLRLREGVAPIKPESNPDTWGRFKNIWHWVIFSWIVINLTNLTDTITLWHHPLKITAFGCKKTPKFTAGIGGCAINQSLTALGTDACHSRVWCCPEGCWSFFPPIGRRNTPHTQCCLWIFWRPASCYIMSTSFSSHPSAI